MTEARIADALVRYRYLWAVCSLVLIAALAYGLKNLFVDSDYRVFFADDDPQLITNDANQRAYTNSDSLAILIHSKAEELFSQRNLQAIKSVTDNAWQAPYSIRVDSLSNFQYSRAAQDDLVVSDLVTDPDQLTDDDIARIRKIALNDPRLLNRVISPDGYTTLINISVQLPDAASDATEAEKETARVEREKSFAELAAYGNKVRERLQQQHPHLRVFLLGPPIINHNFNQAGQRDISTLIPAMYLIIAVMLGLFFRSAKSVVGALAVIALATVGAMGFTGWVGIPLTTVLSVAPVIILTIAVCDSVHLQIIHLRYLAESGDTLQAMRDSLIVNLGPIVLTSVTTAVGFLTLNFAASPVFGELGNVTAAGVMLAMVLTLTLLPSIQCLVVRSHRASQTGGWHRRLARRVAEFVIPRPKRVFAGAALAALAFVALIPLNKINDNPSTYFKPGIAFRDAADFSQKHLPAIKNLDFSIECGEANCINEPEFLGKLQAFVDWVRQQDGVEYVHSYTKVIKQLNSNMHNDDPDYYRVPESRELAAQYQLLYEFSLPFGLDLNNLINYNKSATRVGVWTRRMDSEEFLALEQRAREWLGELDPQLRAHGSSVHMMFAALGHRVILSMAIGSVFALLGVTLTILLAMRSFKYGLLSMVPNAFPAAMGLGLWGLLIGHVNMAIALVFSITLGLVVDNTVHFISKYRRALARGESAEDAVRYAFSMVGAALLTTTAVLTIGFGLLTLSDFNLNAYMGGLTAITIVIALVFDFMMLPALLLLVDDAKGARVDRGI